MDEEAAKIKCLQLKFKLKNKKQTYLELYNSKKHLLCDECSNSVGKASKTFGIRICDTCKDLEKYRLVCKSTAIKTYFLTERELSDLDCIEVQNPHYRSSSNMILYKFEDIKKAFCIKHKIQSKDIQHKLDEIKANRSAKPKRRSPKEIRKQRLELALQEYGLELRADSKLCEAYINSNKNIDYDLDGIVERMCQMKFLYEYCDFDKYCNEVYEEHRDMIKQGYHPDCTVTMEAEERVLDKIGGYPDVYPWLESE